MVRFTLALLAVCATALPAQSTDPLVGTWKFNKTKSDVQGQTYSIGALGGNKYKFTYGDINFDVAVDGTDQTTFPGATWAVTVLSPNKWQIVVKANGKVQGTNIWTLSADGQTFTTDYTGTRGDGSAVESHGTLKRTAGSTGFAGTWVSGEVNFTDPSLLVVTPFGSGGLTLSYPGDKTTINLTMDGADCAVVGPTVLKGSTTSAHRSDPSSLALTDKLNGKTMDTVDWSVSADGKTLTMTEHDVGVAKPLVSVYERQ
jgi:hypothetical protein